MNFPFPNDVPTFPEGIFEDSFECSNSIKSIVEADDNSRGVVIESKTIYKRRITPSEPAIKKKKNRYYTSSSQESKGYDVISFADIPCATEPEVLQPPIPNEFPEFDAYQIFFDQDLLEKNDQIIDAMNSLPVTEPAPTINNPIDGKRRVSTPYLEGTTILDYPYFSSFKPNKELIFDGFFDVLKQKKIISNPDPAHGGRDIIIDALSTEINNLMNIIHDKRGFKDPCSHWVTFPELMGESLQELMDLQADILDYLAPFEQPNLIQTVYFPKNAVLRCKPVQDFLYGPQTMFVIPPKVANLIIDRRNQGITYIWPFYAIYCLMENILGDLDFFSICMEKGTEMYKDHFHMCIIRNSPADTTTLRKVLRSHPLLALMMGPEKTNFHEGQIWDTNVLNYMAKEGKRTNFFCSNYLFEQHYDGLVMRWKAHMVDLQVRKKIKITDENKSTVIGNYALLWGRFLAAAASNNKNGTITPIQQDFIRGAFMDFVLFAWKLDDWKGKYTGALNQFGRLIEGVYKSSVNNLFSKHSPSVVQLIMKSGYPILDSLMMKIGAYINANAAARVAQRDDPRLNNTRKLNPWLFGVSGIGKSSLIKLLDAIGVRAYVFPTDGNFFNNYEPSPEYDLHMLDEFDGYLGPKKDPAQTLKKWLDPVAGFSLDKKYQDSMPFKYAPTIITSNQSPDSFFGKNNQNMMMRFRKTDEQALYFMVKSRTPNETWQEHSHRAIENLWTNDSIKAR